jgi:hypothetical protein
VYQNFLGRVRNPANFLPWPVGLPMAGECVPTHSKKAGDQLDAQIGPGQRFVVRREADMTATGSAY